MKDVVRPRRRPPCCSSRPRTSSRASSRCCRVHAGVKVGHQPDTKQLLPSLGIVQADVPARGPPRLREGLQLLRAEGGGRRQGQDLPRRPPTSRSRTPKALDAGTVPLGLKLQFALFDRLVLSQDPQGHGRPRAVRGLGIGSARPAPRPLLPQPRHHDPRGLRPHRDHGARDGEPRREVQDRHGRPGAARRLGSGSPTTARSRSRVSTSSTATGRTRRPRRRPSTTAGSRPATSARFDADGYLTITGPQEGDHRHRRRQERRPRGARGPDPREPARRPGRRRGRPEAVHLAPSSPSTRRCCPCGSNNGQRRAD